VPVGRTPLKDVRQPLGELIWKFEKPGFGTVFRLTSSLFGWFLRPPREAAGSATLDALDKTPPGMVRVSPASIPKKLSIPGYEDAPELPLPDYWIDQFEVTNRQFKAFVDQGGYAKREFWKLDFYQDGKSLSWEAAMARFRDAAGQSGPNEWLQGHYPDGQDDFPVTGVSWYEAAAYAEFAGKSLPTIYHWNRAAGPFSSAVIVPASNFEGKGVLPVGTKPGMSPWGNYDMAGNVEEWAWNEAGPGNRYLLGGAWDGPDYLFIEPEARPPLVRASNIGFRCVKYIGAATAPEIATRPLSQPTVDFGKLKPVSDEVFSAYRRLFSYDKIPLNPIVEHLDDNNDDWTTEKITYAAGYGNEQAISYLFLPKKFKPPFQTVVFFPGDGGLFIRTFSLPATSSLDAILRSGRAVLHPIYKGTYERADGTKGSDPHMTSDYRDHVIMWVKDASRAIDYAQTRADLYPDRFAYYGYSWGGGMGGIISAVDPRIKTSILALAGVTYQHALPEVDTPNFLPHVKQPVLMVNGRYDFFCPVQSSQEPFFRLLGSRSDQKKHVLYDSSHNLPRNEFIKESLHWLDQYLGPVQ
jgi:formylglycine-generating enzyme required for sulfatase activity/dienelactone hydrolase